MKEEELVRVPIAIETERVKREVVLAEPGSGVGEYKLHSIPAFAYGVALGDIVKILDSATGEFEVVSRSGQVTLRAFVRGPLDRPDIRTLIDSIIAVGGKYELGKNNNRASLLILSVDIALGLKKIASLMHVVEGPDVQWEYGNVYGENGKLLNWWTH
jgi:hypothetical protein